MTLFSSVLAILVIYIPFHLFEEAMGDFPRWMYEHKWLPHHMTHGHWMANNVFVYYPVLLIPAVLFFLNPDLLCCGIAVLVWGLINFAEHFSYTIRDRKASPGICTASGFLLAAVLGLCNSASSGTFAVPAFFGGLVIGAALFAAPILLCMKLYPFFEKHILH